MTNSKHTKRALLASALSLMLCVAMLVGTTFAWFTDTVTSGNNIIKSGNLKVDLIHVGGGADNEDVSLKEKPDHKIFDYDKWEPGYTAMETLKVVNEGDLAFKFRLDAVTVGEITGENDEKLSDVIDVYVYEGEDIPAPGSFADMTDGWRNAGSLSELMEDKDGVARGVLLPKDATPENGEPVGSVQMTVALHMQETAGNEYQGLSLGDLSLTLYATQYTYENDGFNDQYDKDATYPIDTWDGTVATADELAAATDDTNKVVNVDSGKLLAALAQEVNNGNGYADYTVKLTKNLDLNGIEWTPIGVKDGNKFKGVFDGQNYKVLNLKIENGPEYAAFFGAVEDATVKNLTVEGSVKGVSVAGIAARVDGNSKLINCTNRASVNGEERAAGITVKIEANDSLLENCVNEGNISSSTPKAAAGIATYAQNGKFTIKNCVNNGNVTGPRAGGILYNISDKGNGLITGCVNNGNITSKEDKVAGIVSINSETTNVTISDCKNSGTISGQDASAICGLEYTHENNKPNTNSGLVKADRTRYISETNATIDGDVSANIEILPGSTVTINNGSYTGKITNYGVLTVNDGIFTSVSNFFNYGTLTVDDGEFKEIRTNNAGVTTIDGGKIGKLSTFGNPGYTGKLVVNDGEIGGNLDLVAGGGTIEINGGHFTYNAAGQFMINIRDDKAIVTISDGIFDWSHTGRFTIDDKDKIVVTGGTYKSDITNSVTLGEGKQCVDNSNGTWTVK